MVKIHFRLSELGTVELPIENEERWADLLKRCVGKHHSTPSSLLAVRRGAVIGADDLVYDNDIIEVFPALSGG